MERERYLANWEFLRAHQAAYSFPIATKKAGAPNGPTVLAALPGLDFKRVPFSLHIWWAFRTLADRERFLDWILYDPKKHHPENLIALDTEHVEAKQDRVRPNPEPDPRGEQQKRPIRPRGRNHNPKRRPTVPARIVSGECSHPRGGDYGEYKP